LSSVEGKETECSVRAAKKKDLFCSCQWGGRERRARQSKHKSLGTSLVEKGRLITLLHFTEKGRKKSGLWDEKEGSLYGKKRNISSRRKAGLVRVSNGACHRRGKKRELRSSDCRIVGGKSNILLFREERKGGRDVARAGRPSAKKGKGLATL